MGVDRSSLSSPGVASSAARATGDGLAVVRQQPTSPGNYYGHIDDFGSCNLDSIHQGGTDFRGANLLCAQAGEDDYVPHFQQRRAGSSANLDSNGAGCQRTTVPPAEG